MTSTDFKLELLCSNHRRRFRKEELETPFGATLNGERWDVAVNGYAGLAVRGDRYDLRAVAARVGVTTVFFPAIASEHDVSLEELRRWAGPLEVRDENKTCEHCAAGTRKCSVCGGSGEHECSCGAEHECAECDGDGTEMCSHCNGSGNSWEDPEPRAAPIGAVFLDRNLVARILAAIPTSVTSARIGFAPSRVAWPGVVVLMGDGWRATVMPLRDGDDEKGPTFPFPLGPAT